MVVLRGSVVAVAVDGWDVDEVDDGGDGVLGMRIRYRKSEVQWWVKRWPCRR